MVDFSEKKYKIVTYGCQMNLHESEKIAGILDRMGMSPTDIDEECDVIVFNTCCIRDTAERRALGNIGKTKKLKEKKKSLIIAVVGCMTQQDGFAQSLKDRCRYIDIVLGTHNIFELEEKIRARAEGFKRMTSICAEGSIDDETSPVTRTSFPNAWVNINYGCNNFCTYCIVPYVRGRERSRTVNSVIAECERLIAAGYKEITLLGQNVNSYGHDLDDENASFAKLLTKVAAIEGKFRVRFMTSHPKDLTREVLEAMLANEKICRNIHLPVQAGSNEVLKNMNRRYNREHYFALIDMIREVLGDDVGITSDIMVGFPGETEQDFADTLDLVSRVKFSTAFTFIYSPRKGTKAAEMPGIPYAIKQDRIKRLIALQNSITEKLSYDYLGGVYEVLIEDVAQKKKGIVTGRTDSGRLVYAKGDASLIGTFKNIKITAVKNAALYGEII